MNNAASILVINAGSSSIKFKVYAVNLSIRLQGELEGIGSSPHVTATDARGAKVIDQSWQEATSVHDIIAKLIKWLERHLGEKRLVAIGHRVALGGLDHSGPVVITPSVMNKLRALVPLAPMHQPRNLEPIESLHRLHPHIPQVACFDTAFHRTVPEIASLYGLPRALSEAGARRYGFHGLSYEYISGRLGELDPRAAAGRTIVAHLGSGSSLCAMKNGRSIATTMGFSPLSGLVMATRPGEIDAGLMIWLQREKGMSVDQIEAMLYHDCGLMGVSGASADMRELLTSADPHAKQAIDLFVYRAVREIGSLVAALGGLDALVFTAGIGEHAAPIRAAICELCAWLGLRLDAAGNAKGAGRISRDASDVAVWVVPTDEERMVATHTSTLAFSMPANTSETIHD
ncbi:MAG: acetate/propionate family kinase [Salaquimonas sp.]|nr:acetate/propionate family kinase [Salaquimonas sp.]